MMRKLYLTTFKLLLDGFLFLHLEAKIRWKRNGHLVFCALNCLTLMSSSIYAESAFDFGRVCPLLKDKAWSEIIAGAKPISEKISGTDSGVVVDSGYRTIYEMRYPDCGGGFTGILLRFSQDILPSNQGVSRGVYEVFIKDLDKGEITGFALNSQGKYIAEVPDEIAFDKHDNKKDEGGKRPDRIVRSRSGCFSCHPQVSFDYGMEGAAGFWTDDSTTVSSLRREKLKLVVDEDKPKTSRPRTNPPSPPRDDQPTSPKVVNKATVTCRGGEFNQRTTFLKDARSVSRRGYICVTAKSDTLEVAMIEARNAAHNRCARDFPYLDQTSSSYTYISCSPISSGSCFDHARSWKGGPEFACEDVH